MEKPIVDPAIPYIGPIYGGRFNPGNVITIQGAIPTSAYRFNIALQCGPENVPRDDVALQITVRLLDGYVSLNALQNGVWGTQQRGTAFSVKRGEEFEIALICDYNQYKVAINGQHYCTFPQRIRHNCVTHLAIEGDISVFQIFYDSIRGSGLIEVPQTSADISDSPTESELDVSKLIDATPLPRLQPIPSSGFPELPAYEEKTDADQGEIQEFTIAEAVPLNANSGGISANSHKYETIDRYYWQKCCALFWGVILCIIIIFAIVISQADERPILIKAFNNTSNETYAGNNETYLSNYDPDH